MPFFRVAIWSPVEIEYLKKNRDQMSENQLSLALAKSRNAIKRKCMELDGKIVPGAKKNKKSMIGKRPDLNQFFRSNWEANLARYLALQKITWVYEPKVFFFDKIKHGTVSYCPDFQLLDGSYIEVKGFLDGKGRTAINRFKKFYPEEFKKLKVVVASPNVKAAKFFQTLGVPVYIYYNDLKKMKDKIEHWEE
jgi:hypothetical protein